MSFNLLGHGATGADLDRWICGSRPDEIDDPADCAGYDPDEELCEFDWTEEGQ